MKYAIIESGGKQYKAVESGTIEVDRLPVNPGETIKLDQVLLLTDGDVVTVGTPLIKDLIVWAKALEHFKGKKKIVFKYRPKKRIRTKTGHRQNYTRLLIEQIGGTEVMPKKEPAKTKEPVEKATEAKPETGKPVKDAPAEKKQPTKPAPAKKTVSKKTASAKEPVTTKTTKPSSAKEPAKTKTKPAPKTTEKKPAKKAEKK